MKHKLQNFYDCTRCAAVFQAHHIAREVQHASHFILCCLVAQGHRVVSTESTVTCQESYRGRKDFIV